MLFNKGCANIALAGKMAENGERMKTKGKNPSVKWIKLVTGWQEMINRIRQFQIVSCSDEGIIFIYVYSAIRQCLRAKRGRENNIALNLAH